jgi:hypothetical protein
MSTPLQAATIDPSMFWLSVGVSAESKTIRKLVRDYRADRRRQASFAWKDILAGEVSEILQNCSVQGWDGNDAEPVSPDSAESALELIKNLPEGMNLPAVVPEPNGDIAFEWCTDDRRHFSLSVTGPTLVYARIFGGSSRQYGEERFFGAIPRTILEILARYFSTA